MKKIFVTVGIIIFVFLFVLPFKAFSMTDGGTTGFAPIIEWYQVINYNRIISITPLMSHDDPNYEPPKTRTTLKGTEIRVFGFVIYDGTYEYTENLGN